MMSVDSTPLGEWVPELRDGVHWTSNGSRALTLRDPEGRYALAIDRHCEPLLKQLDGQRDLANIVIALAEDTGAFNPGFVMRCLRRLAAADLLKKVPASLRADSLAGSFSLVQRRLRAALDVRYMLPIRAPRVGAGSVVRRLFGTVLPLTGVLFAAASLILRQPSTIPEAASIDDLLVLLFSFLFLLSLVMSVRGLFRAAFLVAARLPVERLGLRLRYGLPFFDVDPVLMSRLSDDDQRVLAMTGLGTLLHAFALTPLVGAESSDLLGLTGWALGWATSLALFVDLCPFAKSDGSLLVERAFGIRWIRGRAFHYLRSFIPHGTGSLHKRSTEERKLLLVIALWLLYGGLAVGFVLVPALAGASDVSAVFLHQSAAATRPYLIGIGIGLTAYITFFSISAFIAGVLAIIWSIGYVLRRPRWAAPSQVTPTTRARLGELSTALFEAGVGIDDGVLERLEGCGRFRVVEAGQTYGRPDLPPPAFSIITSGTMVIEREEVSGLVRRAGRAGRSWVFGSGVTAEREPWRWRARASTRTVVWTFLAESKECCRALAPALDLARRISELEANAATRGLGPMGVRKLAQVSREEILLPDNQIGDHAAVAADGRGLVTRVLIDGSCRLTSKDIAAGSANLHGAAVLPRAPLCGRLLVSKRPARVLATITAVFAESLSAVWLDGSGVPE